MVPNTDAEMDDVAKLLEPVPGYGGAWSIMVLRDVYQGMRLLRVWFPDAQADEDNFVLFSTSGVHGSYTTIEDIDHDLRVNGNATSLLLTFIIVQPRKVAMVYGNIKVGPGDIPYLKRLRKSSRGAVVNIG